MSERANGWLLILGGLAIGLALWLSPYTGASSSESDVVVRMELDRFDNAIRAWDRVIFKAMLRLGAVCLGDCPPPSWSAGHK